MDLTSPGLTPVKEDSIPFLAWKSPSSTSKHRSVPVNSRWTTMTATSTSSYCRRQTVAMEPRKTRAGPRDTDRCTGRQGPDADRPEIRLPVSCSARMIGTVRRTFRQCLIRFFDCLLLRFGSSWCWDSWHGIHDDDDGKNSAAVSV